MQDTQLDGGGRAGEWGRGEGERVMLTAARHSTHPAPLPTSTSHRVTHLEFSSHTRTHTHLYKTEQYNEDDGEQQTERKGESAGNSVDSGGHTRTVEGTRQRGRGGGGGGDGRTGSRARASRLATKEPPPDAHATHKRHSRKLAHQDREWGWGRAGLGRGGPATPRSPQTRTNTRGGGDTKNDKAQRRRGHGVDQDETMRKREGGGGTRVAPAHITN